MTVQTIEMLIGRESFTEKPLNKMPIKDVDSGQSMTWVQRPVIFTPLSSGHQKMIEEKVLDNETGYPLDVAEVSPDSAQIQPSPDSAQIRP